MSSTTVLIHSEGGGMGHYRGGQKDRERRVIRGLDCPQGEMKPVPLTETCRDFQWSRPTMICFLQEFVLHSSEQLSTLKHTLLFLFVCDQEVKVYHFHLARVKSADISILRLCGFSLPANTSLFTCYVVLLLFC